ncbi:hypothetical protein Nepgr_027554 [Nepenthes gracilis]|uniref:SHSP domain-containing protein n=1 Tax=Nepenthes gracilis TaxID=150966 RepID=A0AAD3Y3N3_NEPGR|nr:hypothetical protein Nepgr_027554 [Nepenthes gracilis]
MSISNLLESFNAMSLENWDPIYWAAQACPVLNAPIDWKETPEAHVFMVDLPGLNKEDVKVEMDAGRMLKISGQRGGTGGEDDDKEEGRWHRVERSRSRFVRRFRLLQNAKTDEVKASMENGVLKVVVAKDVEKPEISKVVPVEG